MATKQTAPIFDHENSGLINILSGLYQCAPSQVEWSSDGSSDTVSFIAGSQRVLLKLAKECVQGKCASIMDFRVRVMLDPVCPSI